MAIHFGVLGMVWGYAIILMSNTDAKEMTYKGHVRNGAIVPDEPINLPEDAVVRFEIATVDTVENDCETPTLAERLASVIGKAEALPADGSENHDAYLRKAHGQ